MEPCKYQYGDFVFYCFCLLFVEIVGDTQNLHGQRLGSGADIKGWQRSVMVNAAGVCWTELEKGIQLLHNKDGQGKATSSKPSQIETSK